MLELGGNIKVFLKGESPWAAVENIVDATHIKARIINHLVNTVEHGISFGDITSFELREVVKGYPSWEHDL